MYNVLKYIHENIKTPLTAVETAAKFGYSKWYFCSKFHAYTGKSFVKYVRHFRLQLACLDILDGKKITDVAMDYGYDDISGFNKAFLAEFGCYPKKYKQNTKDALQYHERKKFNMYQLNDRCEIMRQMIVAQQNPYEQKYLVQRNVHFAIGYGEARARGLSYMDAVGEGVTNTLNKSIPVITPGELIVGFNFPDTRHWESYNPKNSEEEIALMRKNGVTDEDIERYFAVGDLRREPPKSPILTQEETDSRAEWASIGKCMSCNHTVIGYEQVLKLGFRGLLEKVECYERQNGTNALYTAMRNICTAACEMGKKYALEAQRLLDANDSAYVQKDLERVIAVCNRVPEHPAASFHEAVQALWFAHVVNTWEDKINANSLGRLDQILYPYYQKDIEAGKLTKDEAFELVCCLWLKLYRDYDCQQSCVGGTSPEGTSQVNELSYMMLDATEQFDFVRCLSVRFSKNTEHDFLKRALEVVGHVQKGIPFFFNDDVFIPALEEKGISHKDACDYTQIGCVETVIPGQSNPHASTGNTNLLKAIEYVLCNGHSMMYPQYETGVATGELDSFDTYKKFYDAVLVQVEHILDLTCSVTKKMTDYAMPIRPKPVKSLLTAGCIESGRDFNDKGAKYDYYQIMLGGIPNLADSLEVIRKFIYEEHKYTLAELRDILVNDYPDESVREEFINKAAKFGNDIDSVDNIAVDITNKCCDYLDALSEKYSMAFHAQPFTYLWMIEFGKESAASPDGRHKGEPIAYSVSPMQGRDFNGVTALFNSISKFPTKRTAGSTSAIIEIDPKLFSDRNISFLVDILLASAEKGLSNVQFNTVDADTLIDAKKHPEKYNNLAVRVSGFSQKFNLLTPELQDHIIGRTKHSCL